MGKKEISITKRLGFKTVATAKRGKASVQRRDFRGALGIMLIESYSLENMGGPRGNRTAAV